MKKTILLSSFVLFFFGVTLAQNAQERNTKSPTGATGNAVCIELEGQHKNVQNVLEKKFKKLKGKSEKGFQAFKGQIFSSVSNDMLDYYWRVEKKGDTRSLVIFFLSAGYDNFLSSSDHPREVNNAKQMLNDLVNEVRAYELDIAIGAQTKVVEKEIKELEKLKGDGEDLVKDQGKLEKELEENKQDQEQNVKDQEAQNKVIEDAKQMLEDLQKQLKELK